MTWGNFFLDLSHIRACSQNFHPALKTSFLSSSYILSQGFSIKKILSESFLFEKILFVMNVCHLRRERHLRRLKVTMASLTGGSYTTCASHVAARQQQQVGPLKWASAKSTKKGWSPPATGPPATGHYPRYPAATGSPATGPPATGHYSASSHRPPATGHRPPAAGHRQRPPATQKNYPRFASSHWWSMSRG